MRSLTPWQWAMTLAIGVGFLLVVSWNHESDKAARLNFLRQQFRLPEDAVFSDYGNISKSSLAFPRVQAIVKFSPEQIQAYADRLDDPSVWRPGYLSYDGKTAMLVSSEPLRWMDVNESGFMNKTQSRWGSLSEEQVPHIRNGRGLCFALRADRLDTAPRSDAEPALRYSVEPCSALGPADGAAAYVMGALDFDTRTLHMIVN